MHVIEYAKSILLKGDLESKLQSSKNIVTNSPKCIESNLSIPQYPERNNSIRIKQDRFKFPHGDQFKDQINRAKALHFFANHELLAIEMMAAFLLKFHAHPRVTDKVIAGVLATISDEQKHFKLYLNRMNDLGIDFGDLPLNDFFWRQIHKITKPEQYFAVMSLTFESANLDFCQYYEKIFLQFDDGISSQIMKTIYNDEISHVALGVRYLNSMKGELDLWSYYRSILPEKLGATRGKGINYDEQSRKMAGLDEQFIQSQRNYIDEYKTINRKTWKKIDATSEKKLSI